jgi:hypothetical protein
MTERPDTTIPTSLPSSKVEARRIIAKTMRDAKIAVAETKDIRGLNYLTRELHRFRKLVAEITQQREDINEAGEVLLSAQIQMRTRVGADGQRRRTAAFCAS